MSDMQVWADGWVPDCWGIWTPFSLLKQSRKLLTAAVQPTLQRNRRSTRSHSDTTRSHSDTVPTAPRGGPDQGRRLPRLPPQQQAPRFSPSCWQICTAGPNSQLERGSPALHQRSPLLFHRRYARHFFLHLWLENRCSQGRLDSRSRDYDRWLA